MPRVLAHLAAPLRRLLAAAAELMSLEAAARELKSLYWSLRDAPDFARDEALTARVHLLARSLEAAADELARGCDASAATVADLRACATALGTWPELKEPFDGQVFEGPLTRETASVVALASMRCAEACLAATRRAAARPPRPSAPIRLRPT